MDSGAEAAEGSEATVGTSRSEWAVSRDIPSAQTPADIMLLGNLAPSSLFMQLLAFFFT